jgi:hypothetical protein
VARNAGSKFADCGLVGASRLRKVTLLESNAVCGLALAETGTSSQGKPCWITEWGFASFDKSGPVTENSQVSLIKEIRNHFRPYAQDGRLQDLIHYGLIDEPEGFGIFRCGFFTESGCLALALI